MPPPNPSHEHERCNHVVGVMAYDNIGFEAIYEVLASQYAKQNRISRGMGSGEQNEAKY